MSLSEEDKNKIKDFLLDKTEIDPTELIPIEDRSEALEYGYFIMTQGMLKSLSKFCNKYDS